MLAAANTAATPKRRGSSNSSVELRSEHSSSINLDTSERSSSALVDGNDVLLKDTSERSYHQQSEELVHNTSDSSFIKVALLKQKQKIWNDQQGDSSDDTSIYSWDRKLSVLKQKQRDREEVNEQRKQQQQKQQRLSTASSSAGNTSQTTSQLSNATANNNNNNNNNEQQIDILTEGQHYLSISMLVYMYSHLRETCRMGHTRINFEDIDVNSFQSLYGLSILGQRGRRRSSSDGSDGSGEGGEERIRYLDKTKSSGSIIRVVIDELGQIGGLGSSGGDGGEDKRDYDLIGVSASREYEQR